MEVREGSARRVFFCCARDRRGAPAGASLLVHHSKPRTSTNALGDRMAEEKHRYRAFASFFFAEAETAGARTNALALVRPQHTRRPSLPSHPRSSPELWAGQGRLHRVRQLVPQFFRVQACHGLQRGREGRAGRRRPFQGRRGLGVRHGTEGGGVQTFERRVWRVLQAGVRPLTLWISATDGEVRARKQRERLSAAVSSLFLFFLSRPGPEEENQSPWYVFQLNGATLEPPFQLPRGRGWESRPRPAVRAEERQAAAARAAAFSSWPRAGLPERPAAPALLCDALWRARTTVGAREPAMPGQVAWPVGGPCAKTPPIGAGGVTASTTSGALWRPSTPPSSSRPDLA